MVWPPTKQQVFWAIGIVIVLLILIFMGEWLWRELSGYIKPKTPTDKEDLVNVFVVIAAGVVGTLTAIAAVGNLMISRRNLQNARETLQQQKELDERRAEDDAIQAYLQQIGTLLTEKNLAATKDNKILMLARAQTFTIVDRLGRNRKKHVINFLHGAGLVHSSSRVIPPRDANFREADLREANLQEIDLSHADLKKADLSHAILYKANLEGADLREADLSHAKLDGAKLAYADLRYACLNSAELTDADLIMVKLQNAQLSNAKLRGADLRDAKLEAAILDHTDFRPVPVSVPVGKSSGEILENMILGRWERTIYGPLPGMGHDLDVHKDLFMTADLSWADLTEAVLSEADLRYANLFKTKLERTDLRRSNLTNAMAREVKSEDRVNALCHLAPNVIPELLMDISDTLIPSKAPPCPTGRSTRTGSKTNAQCRSRRLGGRRGRLARDCR